MVGKLRQELSAVHCPMLLELMEGMSPMEVQKHPWGGKAHPALLALQPPSQIPLQLPGPRFPSSSL